MSAYRKRVNAADAAMRRAARQVVVAIASAMLANAYDLAALVGLSMLGAGVYMRYGTAYSLMVCGPILLAVSVFAATRGQAK